MSSYRRTRRLTSSDLHKKMSGLCCHIVARYTIATSTATTTTTANTTAVIGLA